MQHVLAITDAIKGTSQLKIYKELGFESLIFRKGFRRLCLFYKLRPTQIPKCLFNVIPSENWFKYSLFPDTIGEWSKHDINLRSAKSFLIFRNSLLKIGRSIQNSIFQTHDPLGIKFLTRLRLGLSHLNEHKFGHNFQDCLNSLCSSSLKVDSTTHFFLHCLHFNQFRETLLNSVKKIVNDISFLTDDAFVNLLLHGSQTYNFEENRKIIKASIKYILSTERFSDPLM